MQVSAVKIMQAFAAGALAIGALAVSARPAMAQTENTTPPLKHITVNLKDKAALRMGAVYFMHDCMGCHSVRGARFAELVRPLGLSKLQIQSVINITDRGVFDTIASSMPPATAKKLLHVERPDLTVITKLYSADWLYTYLTSFYADPTRFTGANNVVVHNVAMPDVFASLQGLQAPVEKMGYRYGQRTKVAVGVRQITKGEMSKTQFHRMAKDIVAFLYYIGHPHQQERHRLGLWIIGWLVALTILAYLLYRLYWRDAIRPHGERWWSYWKRH